MVRDRLATKRRHPWPQHDWRRTVADAARWEWLCSCGARLSASMSGGRPTWFTVLSWGALA